MTLASRAEKPINYHIVMSRASKLRILERMNCMKVKTNTIMSVSTFVCSLEGYMHWITHNCLWTDAFLFNNRTSFCDAECISFWAWMSFAMERLLSFEGALLWKKISLIRTFLVDHLINKLQREARNISLGLMTAWNILYSELLLRVIYLKEPVNLRKCFTQSLDWD